MAGLGGKFDFLRHVATRPGKTREHARFNTQNLFYFTKHLVNWIRCLSVKDVRVAHYAITSGWNLEKSLFFLTFAKFCGARTIGHLHGGLFIQYWHGLNPLRKWIALQQVRRLDALILLSEGWRSAVREELRLCEGKLFVVNNPIDQEFEENSLRGPIERDGANVLCFGVMGRDKGVFDILDAAQLIPKDFSLTIQLVGPEREDGVSSKVVALVKERKLEHRVKIIGPAFDCLKAKLFAEAAMFLLPSYAENFSLAIIEAAAAGLPIITTDVGATTEFFTDGNSVLLVEAGHPEQISHAICRLMKSEALRHNLGMAARKIFTERLSRHRIMDSLSTVYDRVLA